MASDTKNVLSARDNPEDYWSYVASHAVWTKPWTHTLDSSEKPLYRWFVGGETNICYQLLDQKVADGYGDDVTVICESAATKTSCRVTYAELLYEAGRFAGALTKLNVTKGDLVFIYMPNILELTIALLATWRIGGICLTFLPNTTAEALADRIQLSKPKIFITSNATKLCNRLVYFKRPLDEALRKLTYDAKVIVYQRPEFEQAEMSPSRDILWEDATRTANHSGCVPTESNLPALVICSSGTTGRPKGIVYTTGGFVTLLASKIVPGGSKYMRRGCVVFLPSHPGWISGLRSIFYPIISGACGIMYDGDACGNGDTNTLYRIISDYKVQQIRFNAAVLRELRLADPDGVHARKFDLSSISSVLTAAESIDLVGREWVENIFGNPAVEKWGQTEGPAAWEREDLLRNKGLSPQERSAKFPEPGYSFKILDEDGNELPSGKTGIIVAKLPLPPNAMATLYLNDELFAKEYFTFPGYFNTKDLGWIDGNGGLHVIGRGDDLMKVFGVSVTTVEAENAIMRNPDIALCAVVPLKHREMYQVPIAFYSVKRGKENTQQEMLAIMKGHMEICFGPSVIFNFALRVNTIPTSSTGKINRKLIQTELQKLITEISHDQDENEIYDKLTEAATNLDML